MRGEIQGHPTPDAIALVSMKGHENVSWVANDENNAMTTKESAVSSVCLDETIEARVTPGPEKVAAPEFWHDRVDAIEGCILTVALYDVGEMAQEERNPGVAGSWKGYEKNVARPQAQDTLSKSHCALADAYRVNGPEGVGEIAHGHGAQRSAPIKPFGMVALSKVVLSVGTVRHGQFLEQARQLGLLN